MLEKKEQDRRGVPASQSLLEEREYDHRGVLLPKRTRVGGIIMPQ